ncbi:MAG: serine/threonine-protein phosphatase [Endomicrobiales bacterium]|nr:serine/threonine-protein phosphatase [Endomicrobiales bacterium]
MIIESAAKTHVGMKRTENQDSYGISKSRNIFFVCDGMGGGAAGDFASRCAVEVMIKALDLVGTQDTEAIFKDTKPNIPKELLLTPAVIRLANRALHNFTVKYSGLSGMGTTVVSAAFDKNVNKIHIYNVGDSRLYRLRNGVLEQLTKDHSKISELIEQGKMKESDVKTAEIQSMITRALGTGSNVKIDFRTEYVKPGDLFMMCSDGLNGELDDNAIRSIMIANKNDMEALCARLIEAANAAGGRDNTTVVAMREPEEHKSTLPYDTRSGSTVTIDAETESESQQEDKTLKKIMEKVQLKVPKAAMEKNIFSNPLLLGAVIAFFVISVGMIVSKMSRPVKQETELMDLAGKVTGLEIDIRTPLPENLALFRRSDDVVAKLQMIQDWTRLKDANTTMLRDAAVIIEQNGAECFKGVIEDKPIQAKLDRGSYQVNFLYPGYKVITNKMEMKDSISISVELSEKYKPLFVLMIPEE